MKILLTGDQGFVGSHIRAELESVYSVRAGVEPAYEVVGLDVRGSFKDWADDMESVMGTDLEAVIHVGGIADNQYTDSDIYLWNSYASFLLAEKCKKRSIPFVFFSSFLVESTKSKWEARTPYSWSKAVGEEMIRAVMPEATILRPGIMWGDEKRKNPSSYSIPYRLATHTLKYLFTNWLRGYVNVADVVEAIQICLHKKPAGTFSMVAEYLSNEELAACIDWQGYKWVDDPKSVGLKFISTHAIDESSIRPLVPSWEPTKKMAEVLPLLEEKVLNEN